MSTISPNTIKELCLGNHSAFDTIFIAYHDKIKRFITGLVKSEANADELAQEIFIKLWTNRESINPEKSLNSLLYTMARNAAFNFIKHELVHESFLSYHSYNEETETVEDLFFAKEKELLIELTVLKMPEQRKRIYLLSREQGLTNGEIANQLNISKKTVENQLSLALKDIRNVISAFMAIFF